MQYAEIFAAFPPELRLPLARLVDALKEDFGVRRTDFEELKAVVRDLAEAQKRTELRVEDLAEAQKRTELRVEELAEAQKRTELRVEELAEAQKRTELQMEKLTRAQERTEDELTLFRRTFAMQIGGLGARWGMQSEEAFRQGMKEILREVGFTAERFLDYDAQGEVFGSPDQIELDVVVKNGKVIVIELKSSMSKADMHTFARKVAFYARKTGRQVDRKLVVTPYADSRALEVGVRLGVEVCTDINAIT